MQINEVLPKQGQLYQEDLPSMILCKPKLMPLKSVTLERLEKMQQDAEETIHKQELMERQQVTDAFGHVMSGLDEHTNTGASVSLQADRLTL